MDNHSPPLQSHTGFSAYTTDGEKPAWRQSVRARLFGVVFTFTLALGVGWILLQPTVYRSSATVLMAAPGAIDAAIEEADVQSVAIQSRVLLGQDVTRLLVAALRENGHGEADARYLRETLRVNHLPDTNLVEMAAEGSDRELLPVLVDTWIDVYVDTRADAIQRTQAQTLSVVQDQMDAMTERLDQARDALAIYREENHIISVERQQNRELARLEGLNAALNSAVEAEVNSRAALVSLREALAAGKEVLPPDERESVERRENELRRLKARLAELTKKYTMNYINHQPDLREIPERIERLETALATDRARGARQAVALAEKEHATTRQAVADLREKLAEQEQAAARFTTIYNRHEALARDLEELETLHRQAQSRLLSVQANQVEKYPQVDVIDRPAEQAARIGPNRLLLLGYTLASALGLGVLGVWLYGFLGPRPPQPAVVTLSGVHMYPQDPGTQLPHPGQAMPRIDAPAARLPDAEQASPGSAAPSEDPAPGDEPTEDPPRG